MDSVCLFDRKNLKNYWTAFKNSFTIKKNATLILSNIIYIYY
jgi:hypothetical protein